MRIVFLTGAGISANAGIATYRGNEDSLWDGLGYRELADYQGFYRNLEIALKFYNERKNELKEKEPTKAHKLISELENDYHVTVITQNVDDLHEKAGSYAHHYHGKLTESCNQGKTIITSYDEDIKVGDLASDGTQLRPNIVFFGEMIDTFIRDIAYKSVKAADIVVIVGTSLQVYPFADIVRLVNENQHLVYIDINDNEEIRYLRPKIKKFINNADDGMESFVHWLKNEYKK